MKRYDSDTDFRQDWRKEAACFEESRSGAFMDDAWINDSSSMKDLAIDVCLTCPVRTECLMDALTDEAAEGVRGGYSFSTGALMRGDREKLRREFPNMTRASLRFQGQSRPLGITNYGALA